MPNPFDWDYLTTQPASADVLDVFSIIYFVVFLVGFVAAAYVYYRPWIKPFGRLFRRKAVKRACNAAMWVFGVGLFFFLIRLLQINPLSFGEPIWMWLSVVALLVLGAWVTWAARQQSPPEPVVGPGGHVRAGVPRTSPAKRPVRRDRTTR